MFSLRTRYILILLLTSTTLPLLVQISLAAYNNYQRISTSLATEGPFTVFSRELSNWRTLVATLIALAIPTYLLTFHSASFIDRIKSIMTNYMSSTPMNGRSSGRSLLRGRASRHDVDDETYNKVMKRGGNIGGLVNDGNTCFMNSVIQSLASSNTLTSLLEDATIQDSVETKELKFIKSLRTLIGKLNNKHFNRSCDYKTNPMLKTMTKTPNKNFLLGYNQEDAQEFFQTILSELEADLKKMGDSGEAEPSTPSSSSKNSPVYTKDLPEEAIIGNNKIGHLGQVYVPASQIDPNLEDATEKMVPFNLLTPVDGLSAERIGCLRCGEMGGIRYSVISGLSLNLPADNYAAIRLTELLDNWIEPEIISGVDCNRCALSHVLEFQKQKLAAMQDNGHPIVIEKFTERIKAIEHELEKPIIDDEVIKNLFTDNMKQKSSKSKQILISRPPPLLAMHINRSVFDPETYRVRKNGARVVFPLKLDLDSYVAEPSEINTDARLPLSKKHKEEEEEEEEEESETPSLVSEDEPKIEEEVKEDDEDEDEDDEDSSDDEIIIRHQTQISSTLEKQDISGPLVYQLRSVIVHYGTHNYGHYIAYRKYRGVWWRASDENIDIVDEDEVLSAPGVFMLFYELDSLSQELAKDETEAIDTTTVDTSAQDNTEENAQESTQESTQENDDNEDEDTSEQQAFDIANI